MATKFDCSHYIRRCALKGPCCGRTYICRFCHDNKENHTLDRKSVQILKCLQCEEEQDITSSCTNCGIHFGLYSCLKCRLFDDNERGQFHCDECGICRVGGQENFFHCSACAICLGISQRDSHKCINEGAKNNCPVCMEDIHTSRTPSQIAPCGHFLHQNCFQMLVDHGNYSCPLCNRSITDMSLAWKHLDEEIASTPMPNDYQNVTVEIKCRDCQKDSKIKFHILGHKCQHCGSYNTSQEKIEGLPEIPLPNLVENAANPENDDDDQWTTEDEEEVNDEEEEEHDEDNRDNNLNQDINQQAEVQEHSTETNRENSLEHENEHEISIDNLSLD